MSLRFLLTGAEESVLFTLMRRTLQHMGVLVAGDVDPWRGTTRSTAIPSRLTVRALTI
jgi:hypothetical protein